MGGGGGELFVKIFLQRLTKNEVLSIIIERATIKAIKIVCKKTIG